MTLQSYFSFKYTHSQEGLCSHRELREEDVLGTFLMADWQLPYEQGVDLPTPHLMHSRAPGERATPARHDKAHGLFAALAGGLTFPGHRSEVKEALPEGRPLTTLARQILVKGLRSHNNTLFLSAEITSIPSALKHSYLFIQSWLSGFQVTECYASFYICPPLSIFQFVGQFISEE